MPDAIHVVVASDAAFFSGLQTTVASSVVHERTLPLVIHLLDGGVQDSQWASLTRTVARLDSGTKLVRHRLNFDVLDRFHLRNEEYNALTYARLIVPAYVQADYAIYIDSDFLVSRPLSDLLPFLKTDRAVYACPQGFSDLAEDYAPSKGLDISKYTYVNAGLLLLNLEKWRKEEIMENLLSFLQKESIHCESMDQTAINWLLRDDIGLLPPAWNTVGPTYDMSVSKAAPGEVNLHYGSGMKPWKRPLPDLSHRVWWLFNRLFLPACQPPNPLVQPRNLARYAMRWVHNFRKGDMVGKGQDVSLEDWKAYWDALKKRNGIE